MLQNIGRIGKIFLLGILLGIFFSIIMGIWFEGGSEATMGFLESKAEGLPTNPELLSLVIFLNNTLVALLASIGPMALILLITWGRENISLWQKLDESNYSRFLDKHVWSFVERFKPNFRKIEGKIDRNIFVLAYGMPALVIVINGWFFGFLFGYEFLEQQITGIFGFLKWIAPHGIIEIPAILASGALGYSLSDNLMKFLYHGETQEAREKARNQITSNRTIKILSLLILLLAFAALIEVFLTPQLAG